LFSEPQVVTVWNSSSRKSCLVEQMIYKPRVPDRSPPGYGRHGSAAEAGTDPAAAANTPVWTNFLAGPRLAPSLALLIALLVSLVLWAGLFDIIHFLKVIS
jgi:hypothetical protein